MPRYRIQNRVTKDWAEVEAPNAQDACRAVGWLIGDCYVYRMPEPGPREIDNAVEAQRRECGDTPFLRVIANAAEIARRDLAKVIEDILLWAERDAQRYGYPYGRK